MASQPSSLRTFARRSSLLWQAGTLGTQSWQNGSRNVPRFFNQATLRAQSDSTAGTYSLSSLSAALQQNWFPFSLIHSRCFTSSGCSSQGVPKPSENKRETADSLEITPEKINDAITDQIPQRPVGVVEGTSYSIVIAAAFAALLFLLYQFVQNFILEPTAIKCFNHTLSLLKADPRITVRLGSPDDIRAWGSNSQSRVARQQIPHQLYKDQSGVEHARIQFFMKGPSATGMVHADMFWDTSIKDWQYTYLIVDVYTSASQTPSRVHIFRPL